MRWPPYMGGGGGAGAGGGGRGRGGRGGGGAGAGGGGGVISQHLLWLHRAGGFCRGSRAEVRG